MVVKSTPLEVDFVCLEIQLGTLWVIISLLGVDFRHINSDMDSDFELKNTTTNTTTTHHNKATVSRGYKKINQ